MKMNTDNALGTVLDAPEHTGGTEAAARAILRFGALLDRREWSELGRLLADEVRVDYTELLGGEPLLLSGEELAGQWRDQLEPGTGSQHLISCVLVDPGPDGRTAHATANLVSLRFTLGTLGAPLRVLGGRYDFGLEASAPRTGGWRINAVTLHALWLENR
jgi:SnoaL-like domain